MPMTVRVPITTPLQLLLLLLGEGTLLAIIDTINANATSTMALDINYSYVQP